MNEKPTGDWEMNQALKKAESQEVATVSNGGQVLEVISRAASDPNIDIDKFERLMQMHERIALKQSETDFNAAMAAAQSEMGRVSADATNPQTKSKYASYAALDRALRPIYTQHGFALSFDEGEGALTDYVRVLCHVSHRGGFSKSFKKDMPADGKGAKGGDVMTKTHASGAAMSYGMRYLLKGIFNVAIGEDDNDGNQPTQKITGKQADDLAALIEEVGADYKKFLKYFKIEQTASLPAKRYNEAVAMLEAKRNQ